MKVSKMIKLLQTSKSIKFSIAPKVSRSRGFLKVPGVLKGSQKFLACPKVNDVSEVFKVLKVLKPS
jgi:hypothetical protein